MKVGIRFTKYANWTPVVEREQLRKGELWMSMHRRHAGMVVGDVTFYRKFKQDCTDECVKDEMYAQSLIHVKDPQARVTEFSECFVFSLILFCQCIMRLLISFRCGPS